MNELQKFEESNKEQLHRYLDGHNPGHDNTQMAYYIIGQGITDYGKFKQARAEIFSHYEALKNSYIKQRRANTQIKILEKKLNNEQDELEKELIQIDIDEKLLELDSLKKQIARNLNELNFMFREAEAYEKSIEGKDIKELEKDYHIQRLAKMLAVHTVWRGPNLNGTMDIITTLPDDMQKPLLEEFSRLSVTEQRNNMIAAKQAEQLLLKENDNAKI